MEDAFGRLQKLGANELIRWFLVIFTKKELGGVRLPPLGLCMKEVSDCSLPSSETLWSSAALGSLILAFGFAFFLLEGMVTGYFVVDAPEWNEFVRFRKGMYA